MPGPKRGDYVEWNTPQGPTRGTVRRTVTAGTKVRGHVAKASPGHPEVEVRSDKSGALAVHLAGALKKVR